MLAPRSRARCSRAGLTLVESCALIALGGVVAAAFVPTFVRHLRFSKIAEASEQLDQLYRNAAAYYALDHRALGRSVRGCLPESAGPTPAEPAPEPQYIDFASIDVAGRESWHALGLTGGSTLRYSYQVNVAQPGCAPRAAIHYPAVKLQAHGDLDGDGQRSLLEWNAAISSDQRALVPIVPLRIVDRVE